MEQCLNAKINVYVRWKPLMFEREILLNLFLTQETRVKLSHNIIVISGSKYLPN
jgi:hypothetical protein